MSAESGLPAATVANARGASPIGNTLPWSPAKDMLSLPPNLDPFASLALRASPNLFHPAAASLQRLRELSATKSVDEARMAAIQSQDPLLFVHAFHLDAPCFLPATQLARRSARDYLASYKYDSRTGAPLPISDEEIRFVELQAKGGPQSLFPSKEVRERIEAYEQARQGNEGKPRNFAAETDLWQLTRAGMSESEASASAEIRNSFGKRCTDSLTSVVEQYRATRDALAASGALSALIFNESAGWTSRRSLRELSDRDFELVANGVREQHPDVLAQLLLTRALGGDVPSGSFPEEAADVYHLASISVGMLAACELGVSDCGRGSAEFAVHCLMLGGCDQPDLSALWRAILARDGLDASALDRAVANLVAKIRAGDLDGLGIHRKK